MGRDAANKTLDLEIVDLSRGGAGVARHEGKALFVPLTAPGDRVRVHLTEAKKNFAWAEALEILKPSGERVQPRCAVFGRCGGCQWQHLRYERQWKTKWEGAVHALKRVGLTAEGLPIDLFPADVSGQWEYRNRVQIRSAEGKLGFLRPGSKEVVDIQRCEIARPEINHELARLREGGAACGRPQKYEIEVLESGEVRVHQNARHAAGGFRQVHDAQNLRLQSWVAERVRAQSGGVLLDLYGGMGNLSRGIADAFSEVHCVDLARVDPTLKVPAHFKFSRAPIGVWMERSAELLLNHELVIILDPPREGLGEELRPILSFLERARRLKSLVLVGCDPDSWAKDLKRLLESKSLHLRRLGFVDLFPQTVHVESLAELRRE